MDQVRIRQAVRFPLRQRDNGFSLVEIVLAVTIFSLAAIPIYYALSGSATQEIETTKLSMARKILESFKEEILARPFDEMKNFASGEGLQPFNGGFPNTLTKVFDEQKKYKDFEFVAKICFAPGTQAVLQFKGEVNWRRPGGQMGKPEELSFILVQP
jgi:prepilin-type N-terminal cleavage/methylation domain-containing protein